MSQTKRTMTAPPSLPPSSALNLKALILLASVATTALFISLAAAELGKVRMTISARLDVCQSELLECVTSTAASAEEQHEMEEKEEDEKTQI